jgi:SAM-dependent methyltransferase
MSAPSSPNIFDQWDTYHKVVAANFMFHREIAEALRRALAARFSGRRPAFLDLGCGDATALAPVLRDQAPSRYKGVDLSETALALAARELADLPCPVTLTHGDILEALGEDDSHDVIHSSFVLHHLPTERKGEFFRRAARRLAPDGLLLLVDTTREEDETLDAYLQRYCGWLRRDWTGFSAQEFDAICDHIVNNDMPEPYSTLVAQAGAAGLKVAPGGVHYGAHRFVCFARD